MTYMTQIIITSPQAVGSVTITAQEPGVVTYHIYWDGRIEKHIPKTIQKGYEKNTSMSIILLIPKSMRYVHWIFLK